MEHTIIQNKQLGNRVQVTTEYKKNGEFLHLADIERLFNDLTQQYKNEKKIHWQIMVRGCLETEQWITLKQFGTDIITETNQYIGEDECGNAAIEYDNCNRFDDNFRMIYITTIEIKPA
jgi:hypothetical protein